MRLSTIQASSTTKDVQFSRDTHGLSSLDQQYATAQTQGSASCMRALKKDGSVSSFSSVTEAKSVEYSAQDGVVERQNQTLVEAARTISRLVPNPVPSTPYVSPSKKDWDILFHPLFDEYFQPSPSVVSPIPLAPTLIPADITSTPSSTTIDQDALFASTSPTTKETQALVIHQVVEEQLQGIQNPQFDNDPFINIFTPELSSEKSSSRDVIPSNLHQINQLFDQLKKWIKDHPLDNVIRNPS
ncbi:hypothetical protein Tco_0309693 [Tanacetum coccineum]